MDMKVREQLTILLLTLIFNSIQITLFFEVKNQ